MTKRNPSRGQHPLEDIVREQLGGDDEDEQDEQLRDAASHGADTGVSGFIYYSETVPFFEKNRDAIFDYAVDQASDLGSKNVFDMLAGFGGAKNVGSYDQFANLMAWYALEEVAHAVTGR